MFLSSLRDWFRYAAHAFYKRGQRCRCAGGTLQAPRTKPIQTDLTSIRPGGGFRRVGALKMFGFRLRLIFASEALHRPDQAHWKGNQGRHQLQRAVHRDADKPEGKQQQPDNRVEEQGHQRARPAENEENTQQQKLDHYAHLLSLNTQIAAGRFQPAPKLQDLSWRMQAPGSIHEDISRLARSAGFSKAGIAPVPPAGADDYAELSHFASWIQQGAAGEMEYLKRQDDAGRLLRSSLRVAVPWARSVIVCAANYNPDAPSSVDPAPQESGWIARYALTGSAGAPSDYHDVLLARLKTLEGNLQQLLGHFTARCYVDTGPLVERVYAKYAGVGWIGKNTCILDQELGSWLFLGVILTDLELPAALPLRIAEDRCGSCTRCIDACPTDALTTPYQMDASQCIAYLTIEKRGAIAEPLRSRIGRQVFGCDICQDVCPWNRRAPISHDPELAARPELVNPALDWLAELDADQFRTFFRRSPLQRTKLSGLLRNVAIAMGNSGLASYIPRLTRWASEADPVLAEAAQWAIQQLTPPTAIEGA
jgi:epoxyqueuosine reductase